MSISVPPISSNSAGQAEQGTSGTTIGNTSADQLSTNEFLDLMLDSLKEQDPLNPSSSDPTQYLSELAQMTGVEQETNTAKSTAQTATEQAVSQAVALIGNTVSYTDQNTGKSVTGTVSSVQITSSGPTLTVAGISGINPSSVTNVSGDTPTTTGATTSTTTGTQSTTTGTQSTTGSASPPPSGAA